MTVLTPPPIPTSSRHEFTMPSVPSTSTKQAAASGGGNSSSSNGAKPNEGEHEEKEESDVKRTALLESICSFKRGELRKVNSN